MLFLHTIDWQLVYFLAQSAERSGGSGIFGLIFGLIGYLFGSYCFYTIFQKLGEPNAWFAWVPLLNTWITYKVGDQSPWWIIGLFIPIVNFVALFFLIVAFVNILKKLDKNPWLLLLLIIPLVNFVVLYNIAFG